MPNLSFFTEVRKNSMALQSLATKFWKPTAVAGATVYGAYGVYEWKKAKRALQVESMRKEQLEKLFDSVDTHNSGFINKNDLATLLNSYEDGTRQKFSVADVTAMLAVADGDHDGRLSKLEFVRICQDHLSPSLIESEKRHTMSKSARRELVRVEEAAVKKAESLSSSQSQ